MKKRKIPLLLLFFSTLFYFCTEAPELTEKPSMNIANSPIVSKAQSLLKRCGDIVALTELKGKATSPTQSRAVEQTVHGVPLWEKATELENGEEKILMVPLEEEHPRHSYVKMKKGNDIFRQFATSFSRLVVRTKGEKTIAHVLTYLPERKFARANAAALDTLGYHPEYIGYEGVVLVSSLNGTFKHGFLYANGKAIIRLRHGHKHTENCTGCSHSDNAGTKIQFNISFYTETVKARGYSRSIETEEDDFTCSYCRQPADECTCFPIYGEYIYCDGCGMLQGNCICDLLTCPTCGNYSCTCYDNADSCPYCESDPCVCGTEEYICSTCNSMPCICCSKCNGYPCSCESENNEDDTFNREPIELAKSIYFVGWYNGANCLDLAEQTLEKYGLTYFGSRTDAFRLVVEINGITQNWGNDIENNYQNAIRCIDIHLNARRPIIVGVDSGRIGDAGEEGTTDHFIVITGRGYDNDMEQYYYTFMDNATSEVAYGCNSNNRLYYDAENCSFEGESYASGKYYTVSQVRPNDGGQYETTSIPSNY